MEGTEKSSMHWLIPQIDTRISRLPPGGSSSALPCRQGTALESYIQAIGSPATSPCDKSGSFYPIWRSFLSGQKPGSLSVYGLGDQCLGSSLVPATSSGRLQWAWCPGATTRPALADGHQGTSLGDAHQDSGQACSPPY